MGEALEIFMVRLRYPLLESHLSEPKVNDENDDGLLTPEELETAISHFLRKVQSER